MQQAVALIAALRVSQPSVMMAPNLALHSSYSTTAQDSEASTLMMSASALLLLLSQQVCELRAVRSAHMLFECLHARV